MLLASNAYADFLYGEIAVGYARSGKRFNGLYLEVPATSMLSTTVPTVAHDYQSDYLKEGHYFSKIPSHRSPIYLLQGSIGYYGIADKSDFISAESIAFNFNYSPPAHVRNLKKHILFSEYSFDMGIRMTAYLKMKKFPKLKKYIALSSGIHFEFINDGVMSALAAHRPLAPLNGQCSTDGHRYYAAMNAACPGYGNCITAEHKKTIVPIHAGAVGIMKMINNNTELFVEVVRSIFFNRTLTYTASDKLSVSIKKEPHHDKMILIGIRRYYHNR